MSEGWVVKCLFNGPSMYVSIFYTGDNWHIQRELAKVYADKTEAEEVAVGLLLAMSDYKIGVVQA